MADDGGLIKVPGDLVNTGSEIRTVASALSDELDGLKAKLAALGESWVGSAHESWAQMQLEWDNAAQALFGDDGHGGLLGQIAHVMDVNADNFGFTEQQNTTSWGVDTSYAKR